MNSKLFLKLTLVIALGLLTACSGANRPTGEEAASDVVVGGATANVLCTPYYPDTDGDTYGDVAGAPQTPTDEACSAPAGHVANNTDCDDTNKDIYPDANGVCTPSATATSSKKSAIIFLGTSERFTDKTARDLETFLSYIDPATSTLAEADNAITGTMSMSTNFNGHDETEDMSVTHEGTRTIAYAVIRYDSNSMEMADIVQTVDCSTTNQVTNTSSAPIGRCTGNLEGGTPFILDQATYPQLYQSGFDKVVALLNGVNLSFQNNDRNQSKIHHLGTKVHICETDGAPVKDANGNYQLCWSTGFRGQDRIINFAAEVRAKVIAYKSSDVSVSHLAWQHGDATTTCTSGYDCAIDTNIDTDTDPNHWWLGLDASGNPNLATATGQSQELMSGQVFSGINHFGFHRSDAEPALQLYRVTNATDVIGIDKSDQTAVNLALIGVMGYDADASTHAAPPMLLDATLFTCATTDVCEVVKRDKQDFTAECFSTEAVNFEGPIPSLAEQPAEAATTPPATNGPTAIVSSHGPMTMPTREINYALVANTSHITMSPILQLAE